MIKLVTEGFPNKEIAKALFLTEGTVRNYMSVMLEKLNLENRTQLAVLYYKNLK
ncbi:MULTISPECIES: response regulator transcription factor [unclassified Caldicellulosiruptor]|uniref:response regulator transcription factor n=1 Tax=unclassified Caldicellulosiruptor TaxID=2622462 RepID=UPI0009FC242E|nr:MULTISPECIES: LuxR C-terminal-related transcriptional regulator [unclassified Caldicellulosiruptor]